MRHPPKVKLDREFGIWLRKIRMALGWSQRDLKWRARLSRSMIWRIENGQQPSLENETYRRLMRTLEEGGGGA